MNFILITIFTLIFIYLLIVSLYKKPNLLNLFKDLDFVDDYAHHDSLTEEYFSHSNHIRRNKLNTNDIDSLKYKGLKLFEDAFAYTGVNMDVPFNINKLKSLNYVSFLLIGDFNLDMPINYTSEPHISIFNNHLRNDLEECLDFYFDCYIMDNYQFNFYRQLSNHFINILIVLKQSINVTSYEDLNNDIKNLIHIIKTLSHNIEMDPDEYTVPKYIITKEILGLYRVSTWLDSKKEAYTICKEVLSLYGEINSIYSEFPRSFLNMIQLSKKKLYTIDLDMNSTYVENIHDIDDELSYLLKD